MDVFSDNSLKKLLGIRKYLKNKNLDIYKHIWDYNLGDDKIKRYFPTIYEHPSVFKRIKEFPIGVTKFGELICIEKPSETVSTFATGSTGFGKTLLLHRLFDGFYHYWNYDGFVLNDYTPETQTWGLPLQTPYLRRRLKLTTMEDARPLPIVNLVPAIKNGYIEDKKIADATKLNIKINFHKFIEKFEKFVDEKKLGGSKTYFQNLDFSECKNIKDIEKIIETEIPETKGMRPVKLKLINLILGFIKEGITSFDSNILSEIGLKEFDKKEIIKQGNIITMLLETRLIPSIATVKLLSRESYFAKYMDFYIDEFLEYQKNKSKTERRNTNLLIPELGILINAKGSDDLISKIKDIAMAGRHDDIGLMFDMQNISKADYDIVSNTEYAFVFNLTASPDLNVIRNKGNLDKEDLKRIQKLKKWEFLGLSSKRNFVVYDIIGNRRYETKKVWGMLIPPLSHHISEKKGNIFDNEENLRKAGYCRQFLQENRIRIINLENKTTPILVINDRGIEIPKMQDIKIRQGINLRKIYYYKEHKIQDINYNELRDNGLVIYYGKGEYYIGEIGTYSMNAIPQKSQPNQVKIILYDNDERAYQLIGEKCSNEWFKL